MHKLILSNLGYHSIRKYKKFDCLVINGLELRHEKKIDIQI